MLGQGAERVYEGAARGRVSTQVIYEALRRDKGEVGCCVACDRGGVLFTRQISAQLSSQRVRGNGGDICNELVMV